MPFIGLGLHFLVALFFAIHALRTGRQMYWLLILFSFPLLGSLVYFMVEYLPSSRLERQGRIAARAIHNKFDPGREVRDAQREFDLTPTAHNQMRLAAALLDAGQAAQAVEQYEACLRGPFAGDTTVILGAARAHLANGQPLKAIDLLESLQARQPGFRPDDLGLLLGGAYAAAGRQDAAGAQYASVVDRFGGIEARIELALWALDNGQGALAQHELNEIEHARRHTTAHTRSLHQALFKRLDAATNKQ